MNDEEEKSRYSRIKRSTKETEVFSYLSIDEEKENDIKTPSGFFNHLLELFVYNAGINLTLRAEGDIEVDYHHLVEDVGLTMGESFKEALGNKKGINRYGNMLLPMDEALVLVALDFSGRYSLNFKVDFPGEKIGDFDAELVEEFFKAFCRECGLTLHIKQLEGRNAHHVAEAIFKGFGRAVKQAIEEGGEGEVPSTKGTL